jgi:hypothetical protein
MYTHLAATSETLRQFLLAGLRADLGPSGLAAFFNGAFQVSLATPQEMTQGNPAQQGLSLWLYRIVRDESRLNDPPLVRPLPSGQVEIVPPPLPLRLHYLVTPVVDNSPNTEQRILGRVLQLFHSTPVLAGALLADELAGTEAQVIVRLEALSLDEIARVWEALEGSYQLCISYEVTLANIETIAFPQRGVPVESARSDWALIVGAET